MSALRTIISLGVAATVASTASARPVFDQLAPSFALVPSHEKTIGFDTRAADDFVLPLGNGRPHRVHTIQVVMFGTTFPFVNKFGVTIFRNSSPLLSFSNAPFTPVASRLGATTVAPTAGTLNTVGARSIVTFSIPNGNITLQPNTRYWLSAFARQDDAGNWFFCKKAGSTINGSAARLAAPFSTNSLNVAQWDPFGVPGDMAFRIITTQP